MRPRLMVRWRLLYDVLRVTQTVPCFQELSESPGAVKGLYVHVFVCLECMHVYIYIYMYGGEGGRKDRKIEEGSSNRMTLNTLS